MAKITIVLEDVEDHVEADFEFDPKPDPNGQDTKAQVLAAIIVKAMETAILKRPIAQGAAK